MGVEKLVAALSKPKRLLVVDDDEQMRDYIRETAAGYWVELVIVDGVRPARKELESEREFTAAILDVKLVNGSGLDLYRSILARSPKTQVVFLTGYDSPELRVNVEAIGPARVHDKTRCSDPQFLRQLLLQLGFPLSEKSAGEVQVSVPPPRHQG